LQIDAVAAGPGELVSGSLGRGREPPRRSARGLVAGGDRIALQ